MHDGVRVTPRTVTMTSSILSDAPVRLHVAGCGDAFGSGGRLQTCFHVQTDAYRFLIDCGSTALIGLKRYGLDPHSVDAILISHFHGDHFGGLPFLLTEAKFSGRTTPLTIVGPPGLEARVKGAIQALFAGSKLDYPFELRFTEYREGEPAGIGPLELTALPVQHSAGSVPHGLRIALDGRVIGFSGDTEWTPALVEIARDADLFICECAGFDTTVPIHLDYATLLAHRSELDCQRMMLTHMGPKVLANSATVSARLRTVIGEDGLALDIG
jgi:ribonuclease BN (tRNA processing enzyme)